MDFSAQLERLQQQANETVASMRSASVESREQLKQRIDQARVDANLALMDVKQQAEQTSDRSPEHVGADEGRCFCLDG